MEKPLFLRERINRSYTVSAYFWARSLAEFPFQLIYPSIPVLIVYYVIKLNETSVSNFFTLSNKRSRLSYTQFSFRCSYTGTASPMDC